ncbi:MAG: UPF0280 family protein [Candidatus Omnitrophica bacterium]|nr:UPF0280 family protein [Candidatus Omnitrophota bacterium]
MKTLKYKRRFYRDWIRQVDLYVAHVVSKETDLQISTDKPIDGDFVRERIQSYRFDIERYITRDKRFLTALKPIPIELDAPAIVKKMGEASRCTSVGPMAAVAGAIAEFLGKDLLKMGFKEVIVENGGDIFLASRKIRRVGIYTGKRRLWRGLCLEIKPKLTPLGICTSSGRVGHSLSFGCADSVVVLSKDTALADAVATATCNRVTSKESLEAALNFARSIKGVLGVVIILKNNLITWGEVKFKKT